MYICILVVAGGWRIYNKSALWIYLVLILVLPFIKALLSEVNLFLVLLLMGVYRILTVVVRICRC